MKYKSNSVLTRFLILTFLPLSFLTSCNPGSGKSGNGRNPYGAGPSAPSLSADGGRFTSSTDYASAGAYAVLSKSGISNSGVTAITGSIGASPIAATGITGFSLAMDASNVFSTSVPHSLVTDKVFGATYTSPTPSNLTSAISSMERAYVAAAGQTSPDFTELGAGNIGGMTLAPGLYKWSTDLRITTTAYLSGGPEDVWIFQVAGYVDISSAQSIILQGGAQPRNIYWQVANGVTLNTTSTFVGVVLSQTSVTLNSGATLRGRAFAQTSVIINASTITP
ncbi:MAG: DUF3494 domain-containing protein [Bdellovibrionaceae bacterium]|nr:DUF3494 domain-containing protein [Bdellovibrio sp.]